MTLIKFSDASFVFPKLDGSRRSLKNAIFDKLICSSLREVGNGHVKEKKNTGLYGINLKLAPGDRLGVIGPNGAGKSTFLRSIAGVFSPSSGELIVEGSVGSLLSIGIGTDAFATGLENIYIRGINLGIKLADIEKVVPHIIDYSELGDAIFDPIKTYSSGMYMKLMFAIVTSFKRDIVLMDEWLSVGDFAFNRKAEARLVRFVDESQIFVFASHSRRQIERLCNRAILIKDGSIAYMGSPEEVCSIYWGNVPEALKSNDGWGG